MATYIAPKTFADGDYLTFTELNAAIGNNGDLHWLANALATIGVTTDAAKQTVDSGVVGCRVSGSSQQIPDSQWTEISWAQQRWGRWNGQDINYLLSDRPTFMHLPSRPYNSMGGYWAIGACVAWAGNVTGSRGIRVVSHGNSIDLTVATPLAEKHKAATGSGALMAMTIATVDDFNAGGGSYSIQVYQDSGDALALEVIPGGAPEAWALKMAASIFT